jgi:hypothetical protein
MRTARDKYSPLAVPGLEQDRLDQLGDRRDRLEDLGGIPTGELILSLLYENTNSISVNKLIVINFV